MSRQTRTQLSVFATLCVGVVIGLALAFFMGGSDPNTLEAAANPAPQNDDSTAGNAEPTISPTKAVANRDTYYPNTEDLAPDEMRVIACGTGMPTTRAFQAAACFLVELGNGDKFLFDCGSGAAERISSLQIPYNFLDKVFIGHLAYRSLRFDA